MIRYLLLTCFLFGPVRGDEQSLADLAPGLSSENFKDRQAAMERIQAYAIENPEKSLKELRPLIKTTRDPEGRNRLLKVAKDLKIKKTRTLFGFTFFLRRNVIHEGKPITGVLLQVVMPGTAAQRDGLKPRDMILTLNGKPFPNDLPEIEVRKIFAEQIPGKKVALVIQRSGKTINLQVSPKEEPANELLMKERLLEFEDWLREE